MRCVQRSGGHRDMDILVGYSLQLQIKDCRYAEKVRCDGGDGN